MKKLIYTLISLCVPLALLAQTDTENYAKTTMPQVEVQTLTALDNLASDDKIESIIYYDGLGRPMQSIAKQGGGQHQDIITPIIYDEFGRKMKDYLPYARAYNTSTDALGYELPEGLMIDLNNQYLNKYSEDLIDVVNPFSQKVFEPSPLNRVLEQAAPGSDWAVGNGHTIKFEYSNNKSADAVRQFSVNHPNGNTEQTELVCEGYYDVGVLYKSSIKDENWMPEDGKNRTTEEFKNKLGQVLLKRNYAYTTGSRTPQAHDTYYVYDDFGNLTYVIPPEASDDIVFMYRNSLQNTQTNYSWITMAEVDRDLAESYNRQLADYDNADFLIVDLDNTYGAQGGFTINTNSSNDVVTMSISLSATMPLTLKQGELLSLKDYGNYKDTELGRISGNGYSYTFYIRNNSIYISGKGQVTQINTSFNSSNTLDYTKTVDWKDLINESRSTDAQGGLSLSIDADDNISLSLNLNSNNLISFKSGQLIALGTKRRIENRPLNTVTINGNVYTFSIEDNSLKIEGRDAFTSFTYSHYSAKGALGQNTCAINTEVLEGLSYVYHYDYRNRIIEKKIPGKGWEYIVYDKLDRPILTQDANMRNKKQWLVTTYDALSRVAYTGIWEAGYYLPSRSSLQSSVNSNTSSPLHETRESTTTTQGGANLYYTNQSHYANQITELHTINYYDSYANVGLSSADLIKEEGETIFDAQIAMNTKGLAVVSKVRVLETNDWITSVSYFDNQGMPIYIASKNEYLNTIDYVKTDYDFTGKVTNTESTHKKDTNLPIVIEDYFTYDHVARLLTHTQTINNSTPELIVNNAYDEFGILINKKVGGAVASIPKNSQGLQTIDYDYNIRGWLKSINGGGAFGDDLFGMALAYNNPSNGATALYNGNISQTSWGSAMDNNQYRVFKYQYDGLNRITKADFAGAEGWASFRLDNVTYDKNGNILSLRRRGLVEATDSFNDIDVLNYTYAPYSNTLLAVNDTATTDGFKDGNTIGDDYRYNVNGSLTADRNKGISRVYYNHLNKPTLVDVDSDQEGTIQYIYDAGGIKLEKIVTEEGVANAKTTQYAGGYIYENNQLKMIATSEGYVEPNGNNWQYLYQYRDHLDNIRLTFFDRNQNDSNQSTEIAVIEAKDYMPFGMQIKYGSSSPMSVVSADVNSFAKKLGYNGIELEEGLGLDLYEMDLRQYDPAIARWTGIDPVTHHSMSPYTAFDNNPIYFADPSGADSVDNNGWVGSNSGIITYGHASSSQFDERRDDECDDCNTKEVEEYKATYRYDELDDGRKKHTYKEEITVTKYKLRKYDNFGLVLIDEIKVTYTNYYIMYVSKATNGGSEIVEEIKQIVSDKVESQYVRDGIGGDGFRLGKLNTTGFVSPKNAGYTTSEPNYMFFITGYALDLKDRIIDNGPNYNPYKDADPELAFSTGILGVASSFVKNLGVYGIAFRSGIFVGNSLRQLRTFNGSSHTVIEYDFTDYSNE